MSPSLIEFLEHIRDEMNFLVKHSENLTYEALVENEVLNRAFVRSLEIIGEASKKIPDEVRIDNSEIDWKGLAGLRDVLIHQYWGVDFEILWNILEDEIPFAKIWIDSIIEKEKSKLKNNE
ncbi:HepT-like ribonuclease domain-containing protein [Salmonirosea aquatica]|uniref:DUF86 domain-containing protein n=1 Tax=Salmonirosea aquatica TaxID=2654236 RepID=A0A7C9BKK8_9BACT|nr:DUF86 domain-containing protein [Cytophagaceae bacterium SJW1-29]